jgi:hypothetical protein
MKPAPGGLIAVRLSATALAVAGTPQLPPTLIRTGTFEVIGVPSRVSYTRQGVIA